MFDDLTKEIKAQLYERVKSPLFGAFAFSWVGWNYRAVLGVVSELSFKERMAYLDVLYPTWQEWGWHCFAGPLVTALVFLLAYPLPARWMYSYWAGQQKKLKEVQQKIEDETPLTQEEANALRKVSREQVATLEAKLLEQQQLNSELSERLRLTSVETERLTKEQDQFSADAKKSREELIQHTVDSNKGLPLSAGKSLAEVLRGAHEAPSELNDIVEVSEYPFKYQGAGHPIPKSPAEFLKASGRVAGGRRHLADKVFSALCKLDGGTTEEIATVASMGGSETLEALLELVKDGRAIRAGKSWSVGVLSGVGNTAKPLS